MAKKATLAELMGKDAANTASAGKLTLDHLPHILGDAMPELPRNAIGRHRLTMALRQRFGDNYRALPGVAGLVQQFDHEIEFENRVQRIKAIKPRK